MILPYFVLAFACVGVMIIMAMSLRSSCARVPRAEDFTNKTLCNSNYMTPSPFKYKSDDETTEFDDKYFNKSFQANLPRNLADNEDGTQVTDVRSKLITWVNGISKLKGSKVFEISEFKVLKNNLVNFTIYREGKDHAKVIQAKITNDILTNAKVIGFKNSYDVLAKDLNSKGYDFISFDKLQDRWKVTQDEKMLSDASITSPQFESLN